MNDIRTIHMVDPASFEPDVIIAQAIRRPAPGWVQPFGEKMTIGEAQRRSKL